MVILVHVLESTANQLQQVVKLNKVMARGIHVIVKRKRDYEFIQFIAPFILCI